MQSRITWQGAIAAVVACGVTVISAGSLVMSQRVSAQENFPDVKPDYWAQPFIQSLAEKEIIVGYRDGTFKPEKAVNRDEFAAMIRKAFNQNTVKEIQSGSVFEDVPENYWAERPIEEAYEAGFMSAYDGNLFKPQAEIPKAQALVNLMNGLRMAYERPTTTAAQPTTTQAAEKQPNTRQAKISKNRLMFPLAMTAMMYPFAPPPPQQRQQAPSQATSEPVAVAPQSTLPGKSAVEYLKTYYEDAAAIPEYAVDDVAAATQSNIVVNYPNPKLLNPNEVLNRAAAAALIHQALVSQGKVEPVANNAKAAEYVVRTNSETNSDAQANQ